MSELDVIEIAAIRLEGLGIKSPLLSKPQARTDFLNGWVVVSVDKPNGPSAGMFNPQCDFQEVLNLINR